MDVREKLVELLEPHMIGLACEYESGSCELASCRSCKAKNIADYLLSHGVTVQEWIPVTERLPKPFTPVLVFRKSFGILPPYIKVDKMVLWSDNTQVWTDEMGTWKAETTHWMPLPKMPQPPKGE